MLRAKMAVREASGPRRPALRCSGKRSGLSRGTADMPGIAEAEGGRSPALTERAPTEELLQRLLLRQLLQILAGDYGRFSILAGRPAKPEIGNLRQVERLPDRDQAKRYASADDSGRYFDQLLQVFFLPVVQADMPEFRGKLMATGRRLDHIAARRATFGRRMPECAYSPKSGT